MDWSEAIKQERAMLMRIVALILSLADLAESAASRSRFCCRLICWIIGPAEKAACSYLFDPPDEPFPVMRYADIRTEAVCMAMRLRAMAKELKLEMRLVVPRPPRRVEPKPSVAFRLAALPRPVDMFRLVGFLCRVSAPDTS